MNPELRTCAVIKIPDARINETIVDEVFDQERAVQYKRNHSLSPRCDSFIARDAGDNLIVLSKGVYLYWDHETDLLIPLGKSTTEFVIGYEE